MRVFYTKIVVNFFPSNGIIVFIHNQTNYPTRDDGKYYKNLNL